MSSLTLSGLVIDRYEDKVEEVDAELREEIGPDLGLTSDDPLGQVRATFLSTLADVEELLQQVVDSFSLEGAEGIMLDNLAGWLGLARKGATRTGGILTATGDPDTVIQALSQFRVGDQGPIFESLTEATIAAGGTVDLEVQAIETGPLEAASGTLTQIVTPITGLDSVSNSDDLTLGRDVELDPDLRLRIRQEFALRATGTVRGIRSQLGGLEKVLAVVVLENDTNVDEDVSLAQDGSDLLPASSWRAIIWPRLALTADQEEIAQVIWNNKRAGMQIDGGVIDANRVQATIIDSEGFEQIVYWRWADEIELYLSLDLTVNSNYPADGDDQVEQALLAAVSELSVDDDVIALKLLAAVSEVAGVLEATILIDDVYPAVSSGNFAIGPTQVATLTIGDDVGGDPYITITGT